MPEKIFRCSHGCYVQIDILEKHCKSCTRKPDDSVRSESVMYDNSQNVSKHDLSRDRFSNVKMAVMDVSAQDIPVTHEMAQMYKCGKTPSRRSLVSESPSARSFPEKEFPDNVAPIKSSMAGTRKNRPSGLQFRDVLEQCNSEVTSISKSFSSNIQPPSGRPSAQKFGEPSTSRNVYDDQDIVEYDSSREEDETYIAPYHSDKLHNKSSTKPIKSGNQGSQRGSKVSSYGSPDSQVRPKNQFLDRDEAADRYSLRSSAVQPCSRQCEQQYGLSSGETTAVYSSIGQQSGGLPSRTSETRSAAASCSRNATSRTTSGQFSSNYGFGCNCSIHNTGENSMQMSPGDIYVNTYQDAQQLQPEGYNNLVYQVQEDPGFETGCSCQTNCTDFKCVECGCARYVNQFAINRGEQSYVYVSTLTSPELASETRDVCISCDAICAQKGTATEERPSVREPKRGFCSKLCSCGSKKQTVSAQSSTVDTAPTKRSVAEKKCICNSAMMSSKRSSDIQTYTTLVPPVSIMSETCNPCYSCDAICAGENKEDQLRSVEEKKEPKRGFFSKLCSCGSKKQPVSADPSQMLEPARGTVVSQRGTMSYKQPLYLQEIYVPGYTDHLYRVTEIPQPEYTVFKKSGAESGRDLEQEQVVQYFNQTCPRCGLNITESHSTHSSIAEILPDSVSSGSVMSCAFETSLVQKIPHCCKNEELNDNAETDLRNPKTTAECPIVHHVSLATSNSACSSYSSSEGISFGEQQENKIKFHSCYEQKLMLPDEEVIAKFDIDQGTVPDPEVDEPEPQQSQSEPCEQLADTTEKQQMSDNNLQEQSDPVLKGSMNTESSNPATELRNEENEVEDSESDLLPLIRPSRKGMRLNEESEFDAVSPTAWENLLRESLLKSHRCSLGLPLRRASSDFQ